MLAKLIPKVSRYFLPPMVNVYRPLAAVPWQRGDTRADVPV
jgi:hypothetical protein